MDDKTKLGLMRQTIDVARKSVDENDGKVHPKVGAILAKPDGTVVASAYRGMTGEGDHAEFGLFSQVKSEGLECSDCSLFVTLEPCTRRGVNKTPCAIHVLASGVKQAYIGTLDPNPHITGRGEIFLSAHIPVERFPWELQQELRQLNSDFFRKHSHEHIPAISPHIWAATPSAVQPLRESQREGLLLQSMELLSGALRESWIFAGRLSWFREMQVAFLVANILGRRVKILCSVPANRPEDFHRIKHIAAASGADVAVSPTTFASRATLVNPQSEDAAMICVEERPTPHGSIFRFPHESGTIDTYSSLFEQLWSNATEVIAAKTPRWSELTIDQVANRLRTGVSAYAGASFAVEDLPVASIRPLSRSVERFKLFRLSQLAALCHAAKLPPLARLDGSPWPFVPPIVERLTDGALVVVDGTHRVYSAIERNEASIPAIVVSDCQSPLPAKPQDSWSKIAITDGKRPRDERYEEYRGDHFRPIRDALLEE